MYGAGVRVSELCGLNVRSVDLADGTIRTHVDLAAVRAAAMTLLESGCESVAVLFANAYANPENERAAREAVATVWPNAHITAASDILPEIREFERTSTTVVNAYIKPLAAQYLDRLADELAGLGIAAPLQLMLSNGGLTNIEWISHRAELSFLAATERAEDPEAYALEFARFLRWVTE